MKGRELALLGIALILIGLIMPPIPLAVLAPSQALHPSGSILVTDNGTPIVLYGGWVPIFEDTTNARAALAGETWSTYLSSTTYREDAVDYLLDQAIAWGFNSVSSFIWMDWWIYNASIQLGYELNDPEPSHRTDRPYQTNIAAFIERARLKGIYVQLRPYGVEAGFGGVGEGRVNFPFPAGPYTHDGSIIPDATAFANFWYDVAYKLASYPNVIFNLYDEPVISNRQTWFDAANLAIQKIREAEVAAGGYKHLVQVHWGFDGSSIWIEDWINQGKSTDHVIYSNHIYRNQGQGNEDTFGPPPYPYDYATQKAILQYRAGDTNIPDPYKPYGRAWKYIVDTYNVVIIATFGSYNGFLTTIDGDQEYQAFQNTAKILNEWNIGYWVYVWWRTGMVWSVVNNEPVPSTPNRVGQALIDAIANSTTPPTNGEGLTGILSVSAIETINNVSTPAQVSVEVKNSTMIKTYNTPFTTTLSVGTYALTATYSSYLTQTKNVVVNNNQVTTAIFEFSSAIGIPPLPPPQPPLLPPIILEESNLSIGLRFSFIAVGVILVFQSRKRKS